MCCVYGKEKLRIRDKHPSSFSNILATIFGLKVLVFFVADRDPGQTSPEPQQCFPIINFITNQTQIKQFPNIKTHAHLPTTGANTN